MISVTVIFESGFCSIKRFKDTECRSRSADGRTEGTKELASGMSEFVGKTSNMDTQICDEIDSLTSSVTGNNVETVSFVSEKNTNVDSVQFVIKTATIEKAEAADSGAAEEVPLTFWQKLLRLFGLY